MFGKNETNEKKNDSEIMQRKRRKRVFERCSTYVSKFLMFRQLRRRVLENGTDENEKSFFFFSERRIV